ncbi:hypothetical protein AK812_SmicGene36252 [Symbiodinium microadriaticum]|uniref:Uncharacterized protein n=1 Tax=Symbiodinium microadriaticum TaxID=2951 RepID=A0A1Q9CJE7_SYMMI|nr:hypothetical protein AK812_SmicGene36252 [Symbiodinium microadriaticum]
MDRSSAQLSGCAAARGSEQYSHAKGGTFPALLGEALRLRFKFQQSSKCHGSPRRSSSLSPCRRKRFDDSFGS